VYKNEKNDRLEQYDLQDLTIFKNKYWPILEEVYINRNMINNIDLLGKFSKLRIIDASNNYIEEVELKLDNLE